MKKIVVLLFGICYLIYSCLNKYMQDLFKDFYYFVDLNIVEDCNIYKMIFKGKSDYIFRYVMVGKCEKFMFEVYESDYEKFFNDYKDSFLDKRGDVIFEYYFFFDSSNVLIDDIILILKKFFKMNVGLKEVRDNKFIISVFDKK